MNMFVFDPVTDFLVFVPAFQVVTFAAGWLVAKCFPRWFLGDAS